MKVSEKYPVEIRFRIGNVSSIYFTGSEKKAIELMNKYNINYVYISQLEELMYHVKLNKLAEKTYYELVYQSSVQIYKIKNS